MQHQNLVTGLRKTFKTALAHCQHSEAVNCSDLTTRDKKISWLKRLFLFNKYTNIPNVAFEKWKADGVEITDPKVLRLTQMAVFKSKVPPAAKNWHNSQLDCTQSMETSPRILPKNQPKYLAKQWCEGCGTCNVNLIHLQSHCTSAKYAHVVTAEFIR